MTVEPVHIAILGGGIGGLTTAHELAERGHQVTIYEAADRLGGKARSDTYHSPELNAPLPCEHGFRYFPGFYRNLRDTLARIPTADGTVADNLVMTEATLVPTVSGPEYVKRTRSPRTIREWIEAVSPSVGNDEIKAWEIHQFQRRLLEFITSGPRRRNDEIEYVSLWEFLDADARSPAYRNYLAEVTQVLVAMNPRVASTRAVLQIHVQIVLDMISRNRPTESVLNGPTSTVWFEPWVSHLRSLDVDCRTNTPVTAIHADGHEITGVTVDGEDGPTTVTADYYVAALPLEVMTSLVTPALERTAPCLADLDRLDTAWMNGLQFYLTEDVPLIFGHQAYMDSAWSLTSISQGQFWEKGRYDISAETDGTVEGILSVIISDWETPGVVYDRPARRCSPEEIKTEVWTQITNHLNREHTRLSDDLIYDWTLDPAIIPAPDEDGLENTAPLLINTAGSRKYRPPADPNPTNLMLAADYIRTSTDLTSMESANEAGRRAAGTILHDLGHTPVPEVWSLEEPLVLKVIQRLDDLAYRVGVPNPFAVERRIKSTVRTLGRMARSR